MTVRLRAVYQPFHLLHTHLAKPIPLFVGKVGDQDVGIVEVHVLQFLNGPSAVEWTLHIFQFVDSLIFVAHRI